MKRVIRRCAFETNSSSSHTVTVRGEWKSNPNSIYINSDVITIRIQEYGWDGDPCDDFTSKIAYAMCMILMTEYPDFNYYDENCEVDHDVLESLDGYKLLLDAINKHGSCKKIIIKRNGYYYPYGYIDHQSCENYNCLKDFLEDWNVDAERFLFDDDVVVWIDNDN